MLMKTLALTALTLTAAAPALAQTTTAEPKKCCCDKMDEKKMDHGSSAPK